MELSPIIKNLLSIFEIVSPILEEEYYKEGLMVSYEKNYGEHVTHIDLKVERLIIENLLSNYPNYNFLTEEHGLITKVQKDNPIYTWIIDPLDGTFNFIHKNPNFAVAISLEEDRGIYGKEIIATATFLPIHKEIYFAEKGKGSYRINHKGKKSKISVSNRTNYNELLIGTGEALTVQKETILSKINYLGQTRVLGSACIDFSYLACSKYDIVIQDSLKPWDIASGLLLILEAGGVVKNFEGKNAVQYDKNIIALNPYLLSNLGVL